MKDKYALYNTLGYWISRLSNVMYQDFMSWLSKYEITGPQWMVLNTLFFKNAHSGSTIADYVGVDRAAITRVLDQLEEKGLVQRQATSHDRRAQLVILTKEGEMIMEKILEECEGKDERYTGTLSEEEKLVFKQVLTKMLDAVNIKHTKLWEKF